MSNTYRHSTRNYHQPHARLQRETRLLTRSRKQRDRDQADADRGITDTPPALENARTA